MSLTLNVPQMSELKPKITVFGVGGAGGNAVNNMIEAQLEGVEFVVANTDSQALTGSKAQKRIQLGRALTQGLGAGSRPDVGRGAAEEALDQIQDYLQGCHMVFITAGMGGGTGTGAAPVIARLAREQGILTVGVVTKPFQFEGSHRMNVAERGIEELHQYVDTLIIIPNQNLFRVANEKTTFAQAFAMADNVLHSGVRGVTDLMVMPGLINLDFADVRTVMSEMGKAMMGTGEASGEKRALDAAEAAISNPLLDEVSMKGARGVLINITGGMDLTLFEVDEAANRIRSEVDPNANIIVGSTFDPTMEGRMRVSVVATGIDAEAQMQPKPQATTATIAAIASGQARPPFAAAGQRPLNVVTGGVQGANALAMQPLRRTDLEPAPRPVVAQGEARVQAVLSQPTAARPERAPEAAQAQPEVASEAQYEADAEAEHHAVRQYEVQDADYEPAPAPSPRVTRDDSFIAPAPMTANPGARATAADPEVQAPRVNRARSLGQSLIDRVTGAARRSAEPPAAREHREPEAPRLAPQAPSPRPAPQPAPRAEAPLQPARPDPVDRVVAARPQEDQLEIPAFLRRQAN
jgi:cell division protein FtsZ